MAAGAAAVTPAEILRRRVSNQALTGSTFRRPEDVVAHFGALQAQDYLGSLWAIGRRLRAGATESDVEAAESRGAIVRAWPMRGTLHFTAAADARWMTELLAPRVLARNAARLRREVALDASVIGRCREVLGRALEGGKRLDREALYAALEARRIRTGASRGLHILGWLAMAGTLCLAGRSGKQHTFALLDEWVPQARSLDRPEALVALAMRYFPSHGPATLHDFTWWSGLTVRDAEIAVEGAGPALDHETVEGRKYWWGRPRRGGRAMAVERPLVRLLPAYDEFTVGYQDRAALVDGARREVTAMGMLGPVLLVDGRIAGFWKRTLAKDSVRIEVRALRPLARAERTALEEEARRYGAFLGRTATLAARGFRK